MAQELGGDKPLPYGGILRSVLEKGIATPSARNDKRRRSQNDGKAEGSEMMSSENLTACGQGG